MLRWILQTLFYGAALFGVMRIYEAALAARRAADPLAKARRFAR